MAELNTQRASGMVGRDALAVTSTNVTLLANGQKVGFIQSASPSESRNIVKVQELGTEGVIQSVPSNTNGGQLSVSRLAVYNSSLFRAIGLTSDSTFSGNPFKTLKDQRVPLEIKIHTTMPTGGRYEEKYIDCWLASYSKSIAANTITVTEQATIQYSDVVVSYSEGE